MAEVQKLIRKAVRHLQNLQKINIADYQKEVINEIEEIRDVYEEICMEETNVQENFAGILANEGIVDVFASLLSVQTVNKLYAYFSEPFYTNIRRANSLMINLTDASAEVCEQIGKSDIYAKLVYNFNHPEFQMKTANDSSHLHTLDNTLGLIMNSLRKFPENKYKFRAVDGIQAVIPLTNMPIEVIKTQAIFIVAHAGDPDDTNILKSTSDNIQYIIKEILEPAVASDDHCDSEGWNVGEVLEGVQLMARNDENALKMIELGILKVVLNVLDDAHSEEELYFALKLLWRLSFAAENKKKLGQSDKLLKKLKALSARTDLSQESRNAVQGTWMELSDSFKEYLNYNAINNQVTGRSGIENRTNSAHCMISYSWANQKLALKIKEELRQRNIPVWMDVEKMEGDVLHKMADAVESSFAVIVCLSDAYKDSSACRSEASYAYKCKKQLIPVMMEPDFLPKGWLGILVGTSLYYNIFLESEFSGSIEKITSFIAKESDVEAETKNDVKASPLPPSGVELWTKEKTSSWLKEQLNVCEISQTLNKLDGKAIKRLQILLRRHPEFTFDFIASKLGIEDPVKFLHFIDGLEKL